MIDKKIYRKGDIVAVRSPENPNHKLVKRIVAMEGEVVHTLPPYPDPVVKIPQGHHPPIPFAGDEPFFSDDSNLFGPIPMALIESKLIWILWPPSRFGPSPKGISSPQNEDAYRHAIATFEKDRTRTVRKLEAQLANALARQKREEEAALEQVKRMGYRKGAKGKAPEQGITYFFNSVLARLDRARLAMHGIWNFEQLYLAYAEADAQIKRPPFPKIEELSEKYRIAYDIYSKIPERVADSTQWGSGRGPV
ncbi:hypothetical protein H0H92_004935 [Tricholoma furcatifolium]|nr:hypothetical protein H0H92_004935 [Tricholoma furcatifolium]